MLVTGPKAVTDSAPQKNKNKKNKKTKTLQNLSRYDGPLLVTSHVGVIYVFVQYAGLIFSQRYGLRSPYRLRFSKSCVFFSIFIFWAEPVRCPESERCFGPVRWPWASTMVPELVTSPSITIEKQWRAPVYITKRRKQARTQKALPLELGRWLNFW